MSVVLGILCVVFGLVGVVGQLISTFNFPLAQRWGLQEGDEATEPLYRRLEKHTAIWDNAVLWIVPVAGVLLLIESSAAPFVALIAGGVYLDCPGRELAKLTGLRKEGVKTGTLDEIRRINVYFALMAALGLVLTGYALSLTL